MTPHRRYRLPDGTIAILRCWGSETGPGRLHRAADDAPLYLVAGDGSMQRYHYDPAADAYQPRPCDLTVADLRPAEGAP